MIPKIGLAKMNVDELHEYSSQTTGIIDEYGKMEVTKSPLVVSLKYRVNLYQQGYRKNASSQHTANLDAFDNGRERGLRGMFYVLTGLNFSEDEAMSSAATRLLDTVNKYGGLGLMSMSNKEESANIKGLLTDIKQPQAVADIAKTGVATWVDMVTGYQEQFDTELLQRVAEKDEQSSIEAPGAVRRELEEAIRKFRTLLSGMALVDAASEWAHVNSLLEQLDAEYAQRLKQKTTLRAKKQDSTNEQPA